MDFVIEFIIELIFEGSIEVLQLRKAPMLIRFLAGLIAGAIYGGLICLGAALISNGFNGQNWALVAVGVVIVVLMVVFAVLAWRKYKGK